MFWLGAGVSVPSSARSNSMKTRFQNSRKRSHSQPGAQSGRSHRARAHGRSRARARPAWPVGPACQKFSDRGSRVLRAPGGIPMRFQAATDGVLLQPKLGVAGEHAGPKTLGLESHVLGDELPREVDGAVLEVLADGEVAEHLEEGEVAGGEANLVDVGRPSTSERS